LKIVDGQWTSPGGAGGVFSAQKSPSNGKIGSDADRSVNTRDVPRMSPPAPTSAGGLAKVSMGPPNAELHEEFDGKLSLNWTVLGLDASHFSLTKVPGTLTITTQDGSFERGESDYKNIFVIDFPAEPSGDFQVTTCVTNYQPHDLWNEAGLILWNDLDNNFKFVYEYGEGPPPNNARKLLFTAASENNGYAVHGWFETGQTPVKMWLRIVKQGDVYKLFNSTDGENFNPMKVIPPARLTKDNTVPCLKAPVKYVGILAYNGVAKGAAQVDASFDFFEFKTLPKKRPTSGKQTKEEPKREEQKKIPTTLAEAHAELERMLSPQTLAEIDAMESEKDMIKFHMGLGMALRNGWGLRSGGPLAKHMQELGFIHPDDMSGVILATFWCKRHGQDFRLKERAEKYKEYWEGAKKTQDAETTRLENAKAAMQKMMMGLQFEKREVPTVRLPERKDGVLRVRFLSPFREGIFMTAYRLRGVRDDTIITPGYYYDPQDRRIHKIRVEEVNEVHAAVLVGDTAWLTGLTNGQTVLLGIGAQSRIRLPLPQDGQPPQLGIDGQSLLAVYPKMIYRLTDQKWSRIHSGDILLPRSGTPPRVHGDMIFFRDEGVNENRKRLWWLTLGKERRLTSIDKDIGLVGPMGPRWENSFSYCVTADGDLWACVGEGYARKSLLHRSRNGEYSIAIMNNSVRFTPDVFGAKETDQGLSISAVTALPEDTLLLVGYNGVYHLKDMALVQDIAFPNNPAGALPAGESWDPSDVLVLDERSYFMSGAFGGVYLISKGTDNQWSLLWLDEKLGEPVTW
jgi:hypothetical protein